MYRPTTADRLVSLLDADGLEVRERPALAHALEASGRRRRLDFVDAYVAACALVSGPAAVASLDRDFDAIDGLHGCRPEGLGSSPGGARGRTNTA